MTISKISDHTGQARFVSREDILERALEEVRSGKQKGTKAIVVFLDDEGDKYDVRTLNAGIAAHDMLAIAQIMTTLCLQDMGYIDDG